MKIIKGKELQELFNAHTIPAIVRLTIHRFSPSKYTQRQRQDGFYKVIKPLHVFKKVYYDNRLSTIANLIIPDGVLIYAPQFSFLNYSTLDARKMRASEAYVHSLVIQRSKREVQEATSSHDDNFKYRPGDIIKPTYRFSRKEVQCSSGIHFFINLEDAKHW